MINKLIKTEEDYNLALSRIEDLMDAEANSLEAEELELLATLVELYEDDHFAIDFPDPVEAIQFRMEQLGLNQQNLVPLIGSKSKVSEVLNKKRPDKILKNQPVPGSFGHVRADGSKDKGYHNQQLTRYPAVNRNSY